MSQHLFKAIMMTAIWGCVWLFVLNQRKQWPGVQMRKSVELSRALYDYQKAHGDYPDSLAALVHSGQISEESFAKLSFQSSPTADRQPWKYAKPADFWDPVIQAPSLVFPWNGSAGVLIVSRMDGSAEAVGSAKIPLMQALGKVRGM